MAQMSSVSALTNAEIASPFPPLSHSSPAIRRSQVSDRTELSSLSAHKCRTGRSSSVSALTSARQDEAIQPQRSQVSDRTELSSLRAHKYRSGRSSSASALTSIPDSKELSSSAIISAIDNIPESHCSLPTASKFTISSLSPAYPLILYVPSPFCPSKYSDFFNAVTCFRTKSS
jgi:hypothetical protein